MKNETVYMIYKKQRYTGQDSQKIGPDNPTTIYRDKEDARRILRLCYLIDPVYELYDRMVIFAPESDDEIDGVIFKNQKETVKYYIAECALLQPDD